MDMRLTFNEVVPQYEKTRPAYVEALFEEALGYTGLNSRHNVLEIGIGTGQATLPFLKTGCRLTAIELGDKMAVFCKEKFASFPNFKVINDDFETVKLEESSYDFIYSAGAFQWIQQDLGYRKIFNLLKPGGMVALFWHKPAPSPAFVPARNAINKLYEKYHHLFQEIPTQHHEVDSLDTVEELKRYGFTDIVLQTYPLSLSYTAAEYADLMDTNCIHIALPEDIRKQFRQEIIEAITANGGKYGTDSPIDLYLAKKP